MGSRAMAAVAAGAAVLTLAACGSSNDKGSGSGAAKTTASAPAPMSRAAYKSFVAALARQEDKAHATLDQGLRSPSAAGLATRMQAFVADERAAAARVAGVQPPRDAAAANALLATGLRDSAAELQSVLPEVRKATSTKDAILAVEHGVKPKGGQEIDRALGQLKKLGYTKGS